MSDNAVEILKFYRGEIRFQSNLLSGRLNAFISSQSFLLIAYASAATRMGGATPSQGHSPRPPGGRTPE